LYAVDFPSVPFASNYRDDREAISIDPEREIYSLEGVLLPQIVTRALFLLGFKPGALDTEAQQALGRLRQCMLTDLKKPPSKGKVLKPVKMAWENRFESVVQIYTDITKDIRRAIDQLGTIERLKKLETCLGGIQEPKIASKLQFGSPVHLVVDGQRYFYPSNVAVPIFVLAKHYLHQKVNDAIVMISKIREGTINQAELNPQLFYPDDHFGIIPKLNESFLRVYPEYKNNAFLLDDKGQKLEGPYTAFLQMNSIQLIYTDVITAALGRQPVYLNIYDPSKQQFYSMTNPALPESSELKPLYINVAMKKGDKAHGLQPFCF
jgi:hypothetical protein